MSIYIVQQCGKPLIKCGSKNFAAVASITTDKVTYAVGSFTFTFDAMDTNIIKAATLTISDDEIFDSNDTVIDVKAKMAKGDVKIDIESPAANKYYQFKLDNAQAKANGGITLSKLVLSEAIA